MAERDPNGWADLRVEQLKTLEAEEFEEFCFDLVKCEAYDRHDRPDPQGPAGRHVPDGGRDILLTVKKQPIISRQDYQRLYQLGPLTEDRIGRTVYSCKTGKKWMDDALDDIRDRKEPSRAVEVLLEGGHFKLFINTAGKLDAVYKRGGATRTPHAHLAAAFWDRMKVLQADAQEPSDQIEILDAHAIAGFLQSRMPPAGPLGRWADRLGVIPLLHGLEEWRKLHGEERRESAFVDDEARAQLRAALLEFLGNSLSGSAEPIGWLVGPPGVGKTRLLIETLKQDGALAQQVRIAFSPEEAFTALRTGRILTRHPAVILIIDDCPSLDVSSLAVQFRALAPARSAARLLVMTPAGRDVFSGGHIERRWFLGGLDQTSAQTLAAGVLGSSALLDEKVQGIVRLSEGYPWFVTLLALEAITEQRPPRDVREAAQWALASRRERASEDELLALRLRRARSLLAASLTRRIDWDQLSPLEKEDFAHAVGLARWQEVVDTALECVRRGVLRRNLGWKYKYVTPQVVEREVIAWLLDPEGHDPGGKALARYGRAYLSDFFETLSRLDLPSRVLSAVARAGLEDLRSIPLDRGALQSSGMLGPRLRFIVRHEPVAAARELSRRIAGLDVEELRARTDERRDLVFAFEELAARDGTFQEAEAALFRLSVAENEVYGNNATRTWTELFFPELNTTYRPLAELITILERRMNDPEPSARLVAVGGAQAVLTTHASRRAMDALDGARPASSPDEALRARIRTWHMLAARFADADPKVAGRAKQVAFDEVRSAVRWGVGGEALDVLAAHAETYGDADRVKLRDALVAVRTYDAPNLVGAEGGALERLEKRLAPESFRERLHQHVGSWRPARLRKTDEVADDALAWEGLTGGTPILGELDWLLSSEAVRAHVFASALGRCDERAVLLTPLRERARLAGKVGTAKIVFARYLGGWKEAGRAAAADPILKQMSGVPDDAESLALAIVELGATEERLGWIEAALQADRLGPPCLSELGRRQHWLSGVADERFERFCKMLLVDDTPARAAVALELLVDQTKERPRCAEALMPLLLQAMGRLAAEQLDGMTDHYWALGAELLVAQGSARQVAELSVVALSRSSGSSDHAWGALHSAAAREPKAAWQAVAHALSRRGPEAGRLILAFMFHRSSFEWPRDEVLAWVGRDEWRGRTVVSLVPRGAAELDPILRSLVQRFGPHSSVANEIIARMHSTNGLVPSLADHDARHLELARKWLTDSDFDVRKFANRLVESLTRSHAYHSAEEDDERRRWGT